jgi:hypothetical protein
MTKGERMLHLAHEINYRRLPITGDEVLMKDGTRYEVKECAVGWYLVNKKTQRLLMEVGKQDSHLQFVRAIEEENNRR